MDFIYFETNIDLYGENNSLLMSLNWAPYETIMDFIILTVMNC